MNNERRQGLKMLLLTACILSANFIATRPAQDALPETSQPQQLITFR